MQKYLTLLRLSWAEGMAYPLSVLLWRLRQMLSSIMALSVWTIIFVSQSSVAGYNRQEMISYIFLVSVLQGAIMSTSLHGVAGQIWSGSLSNILTKPIQIFRYYAMTEVADKAKNMAFIVGELIILSLLYHPSIPWPSLAIAGVFALWVALGIFLHFCIELLFGALGFWSNDVWGPKFIFFTLIEASVGKVFPLDILPSWLQFVFKLTPLPYLSYAQTQLFLGRLTWSDVPLQTVILLSWCAGLYVVCTIVWRKGLRSYAASGS